MAPEFVDRLRERLLRRIAFSEPKFLASQGLDRLLNPRRFEAVIAETTRASQWMAVILVPLVIVISLPFLVAFHTLLEDLLLQQIGGGQLAIFQFLVTALTLGAFIFVAYGWFLWVRTGGFGFFDL